MKQPNDKSLHSTGASQTRSRQKIASLPQNVAQTGITGCILAKNESKQIREAIECLLGWTARVIVIDNDSDDDMAVIAESLGCVVIHAPACRNYDALRMLAVEQMVGEWIFFLDADERAPEGAGTNSPRYNRKAWA